MDILNWVYLIKNKFTRTTVENPATDLVVLGADVSYVKRGDKYQNYAMTVEDFGNSVKGYKSYVALLTQSGTDAPEATVLENSLGITITFGYVSPGLYSGTIDQPIFVSPDQYTVIENCTTIDSGDTYVVETFPVFFDVLFLSSAINGTLANDAIGVNSPTVLEIRIYN